MAARAPQVGDVLGAVGALLQALQALNLGEGAQAGPAAERVAEEEPAAEPEQGPAPEAEPEAPEAEPEAPQAARPSPRRARALAELATAEAAGEALGELARRAPEECGGVVFYAVWSVPGATSELRGVHFGGEGTWHYLSPHLPHGYRSGAVHLRRLESLALALAAYEREARKHDAPAQARLYRWP